MRVNWNHYCSDSYLLLNDVNKEQHLVQYLWYLLYVGEFGCALLAPSLSGRKRIIKYVWLFCLRSKLLCYNLLSDATLCGTIVDFLIF